MKCCWASGVNFAFRMGAQKKSHAEKSGDFGGQWMSPNREITRLPKSCRTAAIEVLAVWAVTLSILKLQIVKIRKTFKLFYNKRLQHSNISIKCYSRCILQRWERKFIRTRSCRYYFPNVRFLFLPSFI